MWVRDVIIIYDDVIHAGRRSLGHPDEPIIHRGLLCFWFVGRPFC